MLLTAPDTQLEAYNKSFYIGDKCRVQIICAYDNKKKLFFQNNMTQTAVTHSIS